VRGRSCPLFHSRTDFICALAKQLVIRSFINSERLPVGQLYVLRRGIVVKMWRFLSIGKVLTTPNPNPNPDPDPDPDPDLAVTMWRVLSIGKVRAADMHCPSRPISSSIHLLPPPISSHLTSSHPIPSQVWGEDIILDNAELIDHSQAVALTCARASPHTLSLPLARIRAHAPLPTA
jgi:hypothetical protein